MWPIGAAPEVSISCTICPVHVVSIVECPNFAYDFISRHQSAFVLMPVVRTVGNIVTGDDMQTQVMTCNLLK